jgi:hypothetical protein
MFFLSNSNSHTKRALNFQEDEQENFGANTAPTSVTTQKGQRQGITHNTLITFSNPQVTSQYMSYPIL